MGKRILIACEFSGVVREAFKKRGWDAWSCDLMDTLIPGQHIKDDVLNHLDEGWDMVIAHPPCTHLAVSGAKYFKQKQADGRQQAAIDFFMNFTKLKCERVCIENPVGIMSKLYRKPNQIIQPWQFGHPESKKTCLWLKGLPLLQSTFVLPKPANGLWENQTTNGQNKLLVNGKWIAFNDPRTPMYRGITYQGIADAMASQWG